MNKKMKKVLTGVLALLVFVALVVCAPVSRIVYSIYDTNRTNEILAQLEAEKNAAQASESTAVNNFHKQAYLTKAEETSGDKKIETTHLLVLTSADTYELNFYERMRRANLVRYSMIIIATVPIMCVYPFIQKYFDQGVMIGAVKG